MVYNPGGQIGKSVQRAGQRPAKDPDGPFLGKSARSADARPGKTGIGARTGTTNKKAQRSR